MSPRNSLMQKGGDSTRHTLRVNDEVQKILEDQNQKSEFIREAILHYASSDTYQRRKINLDTNTNDNASVEKKEKEQPEKPVRILHKPAWQR